MAENYTTSTPYDDVFRTLLNDYPHLIIPVVNEVFQRNHLMSEKVYLSNNEIFITSQGGKQTERITDSNFLIESIHYHMECQSTEDGSILIRMFEYDSQIALRNSVLENNTLTVNFPNTAILYLRYKKKMPDYMNMILKVPDDMCRYKIPVMKIRSYSVNEIFDKKLYFLIPFHIFVYEKNFKKYNSNDEKLTELISIYEQIVDRLDDCVKRHELTEAAKSTIIDMAKKVLEQISRKYSNVKKGLGEIMGGKILDYPTKDILNAGRAEGRTEGKIEDILEFLEELGTVPEKLRELILAERNLDTLKLWFKLAIKSKTVEEFQEKIQK